MILAFLALAWLLGIAAAAYTGGDTAATVAAAGLLCAATFAARPRPATLILIAAGTLIVFAAAWRYDDTTPTMAADSVSRFNGAADVRFRALVDDQPQERSTSIAYRLAVREISVNGIWQQASGSVLMTSSQYRRYQYGQLIEVRGELASPPVFDDFDYREYLARRGIGSQIEYPRVQVIADGQGSPIKSAIIDLRSDLSASLEEALPQPQSSLAAGILFGARSALPRDLRDQMDATGTSHLVAVSGQNITILAAAVIAVFAWLLGRRTACWIALAAILTYAAFVGAQPSVVRAAIMGALFILSIAFGRQNTAWVALLSAAGLMTALDPQIVHDVSFQLSFAAVLGLVVLSMPLRERIDALVDRWPAIHDFPLTRPATDLFAMSAASIAFTLPITAVNFHQVSLAAPLANLFAVPAFAAVAATSGLVAIAGVLSPQAAAALAWFAWLPAAYMVWAIKLFAGLPAASIGIDSVSTPYAVVYFALLTAGTLALRRIPPGLPEIRPLRPIMPVRRLSPIAVLLVVGLSSVLVWLAVSAPASGRLSVTVLDVGQGEAILVEAPSGNRVLIDGGPSGSILQAALGRNLPFYDRRLDLVVVTHPQADHIGGLPAVLDNYQVGAALQMSHRPQSAVAAEWDRLLTAAQIPTIAAARGQTVNLGDDVSLTVLAPLPGASTADENDSSLVLRLNYGRFSMLLTADIGTEGEAALQSMGTNVKATVLKVAHHGSLTSTSEGFLSLVQPSVAVISVGTDNRFGHPAPEVLQRLTRQQVFRTDQQGDVTVSTDGEQVWVSTQHGN